MTRLKLKAEETGETQTALASQLKVSNVHLNKVLNGKVSPSLEMAFRLAAKLGAPVGFFWELTEVGIRACTTQNRRR